MLRPEGLGARALAQHGLLRLAAWVCLAAALGLSPARADERPEQPTLRSGTGFFVTPAGHILTAHHVLGARETAFVKIEGLPRVRPAQVVRRDVANDLVLLKVELDTPAPALALARWDAVPLGLEAYVLGFPLPGVQGTSIKITQGIINGEAGRSAKTPLFQLSAEIQRGNSGGPVLSPDGLVTGMVFSKLDAMRVAQKVRDLPQNVNYAVNAAALADFLSQDGVQVRAPDLAVKMRPFELLRAHRASVVLVLVRQAPRQNPPRAP